MSVEIRGLPVEFCISAGNIIDSSMAKDIIQSCKYTTQVGNDNMPWRHYKLPHLIENILQE